MTTALQTVLVTGVAQGIGRTICERLLEDGYRVLGMDISAQPPDGLSAFEQVDLTDARATRLALGRLTRRYDITRLVNNVGSSYREFVRDGTGQAEHTLVRLNLACAIACAQAVLPAMRQAGEGRIVNLISRAVYGRDTRSVYAATKSALLAMTRSWALELAADGISVNAVGPGMINTELFRRNNPPDAPDVSRLREAIPMKRIGEPSEVAHAVAFLLHSRSTYITGQSLFVCGGLSVAKTG